MLVRFRRSAIQVSGPVFRFLKFASDLLRLPGSFDFQVHAAHGLEVELVGDLRDLVGADVADDVHEDRLALLVEDRDDKPVDGFFAALLDVDVDGCLRRSFRGR